jgi:hypothetical protein
MLCVLAAVPAGPAAVVDRCVVDLEQVAAADRPYTRYLSRWPAVEGNRLHLDASVRFWVASLSNRRVWKPPEPTADGELYRIDIRNYGWSHESWEQIARANPYFRVSTAKARGWLDPASELALRTATGSVLALARADWFVARTSLDRGGVGFFKGFYSDFKGLPESEAELFKLYAIDEKYLDDNFLLRGGAVLQSIVASHNRELQLFPTVWGRDVRFLWRSLDTRSDVGETSVIEHFKGSVKFAGREYIGSNQNGTHYYYLSNAEGKQLAEVPTDIAQDKSNPHDARVLNPYSCVRCHGPQSGIRDFADVVSRTALSEDVALAVIAGDREVRKSGDQVDAHKPGQAGDDQTFALEEYYLSELGTDITTHQKSYATAVHDVTGLAPPDNTDAYASVVEGYLWGRVDAATAANECGVDEATIKLLLKSSGNPHALVLLGGSTISREAWEDAFGDVMRAAAYAWDGQMQIKPPEEEGSRLRAPGRQRAPDSRLRTPGKDALQSAKGRGRRLPRTTDN